MLNQQGRVVPLFSRTPGLNIETPADQLPIDPEKSPLSVAYNVDLTEVGGVARRYGYKRLCDLVEPHSLWADGDLGFVVSQSQLYQIYDDGTVTSVRDSLLPGLRMYYARVGRRVYYENTQDSGILVDGVNSDWELLTPSSAPPEAVYSKPVLGKFLTSYHGRLYCAVDDFLCFTEYMNLHATRLNHDVIQIPAEINFIAASEEVLWIGTAVSIVALTGGGPKDFKFVEVSNYPAMENSVAKVPSARYKTGTWWFCNTRRGICALGPGGAFDNLSQDSCVLPGTRGCAAVFPSGKYVVTFE